jgi:hypothetical protein
MMLIGALQIARIRRKSAPVRASTQPAAEAVRADSPASMFPHNGPPRCPTFGSFPEPPVVQIKGTHTVILSWTASAAPDTKHGSAIGYCIYRGTKSVDKSLVRVNSLSFPGTTCTDDMVQTGQTYFYKVKAISENEKTSDSTEFAPASILDRKPANPIARLPALCRDASQYPTAGQHQ